MKLVLRMLSILAGFAIVAPAVWAGEPTDAKAFVEAVFKDRIEDLKKGFYCKALSCEVDIASVTVMSTAPKTFTLSTSGSLQGTIPGLKGTAKRTLSLSGSYILNTCVVKDIKPVVDTTEHDGWGSSQIEKVFKSLVIPTNFIMTREDCTKVDEYLASL